MRKYLKAMLLIGLLVAMCGMTVGATEDSTIVEENMETVIAEDPVMGTSRGTAPQFLVTEWDMIQLINEKRVDNGLQPLTTTAALQEAAGIRAQELAQKYRTDGIRPNGKNWGTVLAEVGAQAEKGGELVNYNTKYSTQEFLNAWLNNSSAANYIYGNYAHIGAGYYNGAYSVIIVGHSGSCYPGGTIDWEDYYYDVPAGKNIQDESFWCNLTTSYGEDAYLLLHSDYLSYYDKNKIGFQKVTMSFLGYKIKTYIFVEFKDVKDDDQYYYDCVYWGYDNGIVTGTSATTFSPDASCTRAQAVTFLWRAAGCPNPSSYYNPFTDVKSSDYFYKAVLWARENGITTGVSSNKFAPGNTCVRGQIVTFLWRTVGDYPSSYYNPFRDVRSSDYYYEPVLWAVENGITSGTSATTFAPSSACTRAQIVTFLYRALAE